MMDPRGLILLLYFFISNIRGAVLPERENGRNSDFDIHFKQMGLKLGVKLEDKYFPLKGGKMYAELAVQDIFNVIKGHPMLLMKVNDDFKDILTVKIVTSYHGENFKSGLFDVKIDFTIGYIDHTEETGTLHAEVRTGPCLVLEIVSKNEAIPQTNVLKPFRIEASFLPNDKIQFIYSRSDDTFHFDLWKEGQQIKLETILKLLGNIQTLNVDINIAEKKILAVHKHNSKTVTHLEVDIQKEKILQLVFPVEKQSLIFKKTSEMISADIIENDALKVKLLMKSETSVDDDTKFSSTLETSLAFPVESEIHDRLCGLPQACFKMLTVKIPFAISVVGDGSKAFRKYDYRVSVSKDNVEMYKAKICYRNSPEEKDFKLSFPIQSNSFIFKQTGDMMSAEIIENGVTNAKFVIKSEISVDDDTQFSATLKTSFDFPKDSDIHEKFCGLFPRACFKKLTVDIPFQIIVVGDGTKAVKKYDFKVLVKKDNLEIHHLEISNKQSPYKLIFKSQYDFPFVKYFTWAPVTKLPFQILMEFHPNEKRFLVKSDIFTHATMIQIINSQDKDFIVEFNHEAIAKFNIKEKKVELIEMLKNGKEAKHMITWTGADFLENTATATLIYKDVPLVLTIGWNVRDLAHGTVMVDVVGKKAPIFEDCEFRRNVKWNVVSAHEFEMTWTGKSATNIVQSLPTPILTDAKINFNIKNVQVKIQEKFNSKTYTLIFNTKPFKLALLPFFEIEG